MIPNKKLTLAILLAVFSSGVFAQVKMYRDTTVKVFKQNTELKNAWGGGFNSPVFAEIDLNGDGLMDLVTYESTNTRLDPFINTGAGSKNYIYAPQYRSCFPTELEGWIRTYDFDHDGDMDLFTYAVSGIMVYQNNYNASTGLQFSLYTNQLLTHYGSTATNIYVTRVNIPALSDIDNDGDMDVLAFSIAGSYVEYHKNLAMDSLSDPNGFLFYYVPVCWGYFSLGNFSNVGNMPPVLPMCPLISGNPFRLSIDEEDNTVKSAMRHSGSSLLALDMDGDGDKDLLNGDILGPNLLYLKNCGTADSSYVCDQDSLFPVYDTPAMMHDIASPYYMDVNNDGNKDLVVANFFTGEDYKNVLMYKNTTNNSTNVFSKRTDRFISDEMMDHGTGAHPAFIDIDNDGLLDLIVSNDFYYNNASPVSHVAYYRNTGTVQKAEYTLMDSTYLNIPLTGMLSLHPAFGDLDGDGDKDLILGELTGILLYFQNTAAAGQPANFVFSQANYQSIDVGDAARPQIIDVDRDGKLDMIIGERNGTLNYYRNTGSVTAPVFSLITQNFGGVDVIKVNHYAGFNSPVLFDHNGSYELLVGSESGYLYHYNNIDGNLGGTFTLLDSMYQNIWEPVQATPALGDVDGDGKYDLVIGNLAGGCVLYSQNTILSVNEKNIQPSFAMNIYPNPGNGVFTIKLDRILQEEGELTVTDLTGRVIFTSVMRSEVSINLSDCVAGTYLCSVYSNGSFKSGLIIKQ